MKEKDLAHRASANPLIIPSDFKATIPGMEITCLLNPGVFRYNGKTCLVIRVAERPPQEENVISTIIRNPQNNQFEIISFQKGDPELKATDPRVVSYKGQDYLTTLSYLRLFFSDDNIHFYEDPEYPPIFGEGPFESFGIEDCRIAKIENTYHLIYSAISPVAVAIGMMQTSDWKSFSRKGLIFPPHNKDCAFFEERINGKYCALHRPSSPEIGGNYIWLAESPDLIHWGNHTCLMTTRRGMWDEARIGAGTSPIKIPEGWLAIYHGADYNNRYCLGAVLMDKKNPSKIIKRSTNPIMEPLFPYEREGFFGNVVFSNGHYVEGDTIHLYYGASDEFICYATLSIREILDNLEEKI